MISCLAMWRSGGWGWPWLEPWHKSMDYWGQIPEWTMRKWKVCLKSNLSGSFAGRGIPVVWWWERTVSTRGLLCCCCHFYFSLWKLSYSTYANPEDNILYPLRTHHSTFKSILFFAFFLLLISFISPFFISLRLRCNLYLVKIHPFGYVVLWVCMNAYIHITTPKINT